jgi:NAD(P)H-dependent FMN reductase
MGLEIALFYGSYRSGRLGIRLADYLTRQFAARGHNAVLVDARAEAFPMLDKMYKEYPEGEAPEALERVAGVIRRAEAFVFVAGEYNQGVQPGLKNLTDHFLEEWFWRPSAIACYSAGVFGGVRAMMNWRVSLAEMGMPTVSEILPVGRIHQALDAEGTPTGEGGERLERAFPKFAADLEWWAEAAKAQKAVSAPPY